MSFKYFNVKNGLTTGNISLHSANANVQANYFLGNISVTSSANLGAVGNLKITGGSNGYVLQTDGLGNLSWASQSTTSATISNGNSNVNIPFANGNVNISAVGNANVLVITGTGANITGSLDVTGNITAGNINAGSGTGGNISGGNVISANTFIASGNITASNANLGNAVTANYFIGNFYGTANLATYATTANSVAGANVSGQVSNALVSGTVYTAAQPNITSVGTLTGLTSNGVVNFANTSNTTLGAVGNVHITGGSNGQYLQTDGSGTLSWSTVSSGSASNISNGNSNVNIPSANGNVNISAVGNANVLVITGTGANITGTLNVTGNATFSNLTTSGSGGNISNVNVISANTFVASGTGSFGANVNMNTQWINNVGYPNLSTDAATKAYVDTMVSSGIAYHQPVLVATTTTLATATGGTTSYNSPNGAANGIGAYISTTGTFLNIDGANVQTIGTRILVKDEANSAWNGVYTYANTTAIIRSTDTDEYGPDSTEQLSINDYFFVQNGTVNKGIAYVVSAPSGTITFGTSNIIFAEFSTSQVYTAGTGLTLTGTTFSVNASQTQITSVGTLTGLAVNGNITAANITANTGVFTGNGNGLSSIVGANVSGQVGNATVAGTVYTNAQPNITSIGNLTGLTVSNTTGVVDFTTTANVTLGAVGNLHISGGTTGQYLQTDGSGGLSWSTVATGSASNISNGNSNVNIPSANGNVNISAVGNANVLVVTGTGANITGTLNVTGNANVGNIGATGGVFTTVAGNLTTNAQPNITSVGTLTSLTVSGNVTAGNLIGALANGNSNINIPSSNGNINLTAVGNTTMVITGIGANIAGTLNVTGNITVGNIAGGNLVSANYFTGTLTTAAQPNITSVGTLTSLTVTGNIGAGNVNAPTFGDHNGTVGATTANTGAFTTVSATGQITSTLATGTAPFVVTSTTQVANLNVAIAGTVSNSAQPNITSVGTLTSLAVTGNITSGNANLGNLVTANYFTGNGSLLTGISAGNATVAETVSNAAQPNITSVGTLTSLAVSGTTNLGNVGNITITGGNANSYLRTDGSGSLSWNALPTTTVTVDSFNGDGTTTAFTLSVTPTSKAYTTVTVGGVTQYQSSYTVTGTTLTFSSPPPSGTVIEVQTIASGGSATPITINTIGGSAYVGVSANTTMVAGNVYIVNTSSANLTMTLPASGNLGDSIGIIDGTGNSNTHAITVSRNGGNIMGSATDMVITTPRAGLTMVYYNSTQGWILTQV